MRGFFNAASSRPSAGCPEEAGSMSYNEAVRCKQGAKKVLVLSQVLTVRVPQSWLVPRQQGVAGVFCCTGYMASHTVQYTARYIARFSLFRVPKSTTSSFLCTATHVLCMRFSICPYTICPAFCTACNFLQHYLYSLALLYHGPRSPVVSACARAVLYYYYYYYYS